MADREGTSLPECGSLEPRPRLAKLASWDASHSEVRRWRDVTPQPISEKLHPRASALFFLIAAAWAELIPLAAAGHHHHFGRTVTQNSHVAIVINYAF